MERVLKNAAISILSKSLVIFSQFSLSSYINFAKCYPYAKFQVNWIIQTEITEGQGGEGAESASGPYQFPKSQGCLG